MSLSALPGGDLIERGLADLAAGRETAESLLVSIGDPDRLYDLLAANAPDAAHGRYNALVRRLVSFERALCASG